MDAQTISAFLSHPFTLASLAVVVARLVEYWVKRYFGQRDHRSEGNANVQMKEIDDDAKLRDIMLTRINQLEERMTVADKRVTDTLLENADLKATIKLQQLQIDHLMAQFDMSKIIQQLSDRIDRLMPQGAH